MSQSVSAPLGPGRSAAQSSAANARGADALPVAIIAINTVAFALCFAVWVMFGPSVRVISADLNISPTLASLIKACPILIGSVLRIPVGIMTDRLGARLMFPLLMWFGAGAVLALSFATTLGALVFGGLAMGLVGTTFAVGVQSTATWTPKEKQGFALGIFGAGNVGTAITTFGMPLLLAAVGWRSALQTYAGGLALAGAAYWMLVRNAPRKGAPPTFAGLMAPLKDSLAWLLGLYYMATFGVFVAATLILSDIYIDGYGVAATTAGVLATTFTFTASLCRIPGGMLADRFGAGPVSRIALLISAAALAAVVVGLPLAATVSCVFVGAVALGIGMASTFKFVPMHFPASVGAVGGIVGALGGLGGFFLPLLSGAIKTAAGSVYIQLAPLPALIAVALVTLVASERLTQRTLQTLTVGANAGWPALPESLPLANENLRADEDADKLTVSGSSAR